MTITSLMYEDLKIKGGTRDVLQISAVYSLRLILPVWGEQVKEACAGRVLNISILDVMDGPLCPASPSGMPVIKSLRPCTRAAFDVHRMVEEPGRYVEDMKNSVGGYHNSPGRGLHASDRVVNQIGSWAESRRGLKSRHTGAVPWSVSWAAGYGAYHDRESWLLEDRSLSLYP